MPEKFIGLLKLLDRKNYQIFYRNQQAINPKSSHRTLDKYATDSLISHYQNSLVCLKYLVRKNFNIEKDLLINIQNPEFNNIYGKVPIIHVSVHVGPNIIIPYIYSEYLKIPVVTPVRKVADRPFNKLMKQAFSGKYHKVVNLGEAGKTAENVLKNNGVLMLALDAILPTKYKTKVEVFDYEVEMANGVVWLAEKYHAKVIPAVAWLNKKQQLQYDMYPTLELKGPDKMQQIADAIELLISKYKREWNINDDFTSAELSAV